ncbi:histone-fold-containing protein [Ceraceosorus guamensis]|uniref:Histone-fold-containing protein n=1 Tax=Ceraceosorus guamensis TaxID=1522189 RepID=A0A316VZP9_9BASI|nr:histone-fold-containing protein [Ceraceosorus guamensis]PWN43000.1 histone-fold-containing protein [Ceraceosorus guamensis]
MANPSSSSTSHGSGPQLHSAYALSNSAPEDAAMSHRDAAELDDSGEAQEYEEGAEELYDDLEGLPADFDPEDPNHPALPPLATLPIANISRLMKLSIPASSKIARDAKDCVQDCVCEFIAFLTSEAADRCLDEKRKTINGDDVLYAMRTLGFDDYEAVCNVWLSRYRMAQEATPRKRSRRGAARGTTDADEGLEDDEDQDGDDGDGDDE